MRPGKSAWGTLKHRATKIILHMIKNVSKDPNANCC